MIATNEPGGSSKRMGFLLPIVCSQLNSNCAERVRTEIHQRPIARIARFPIGTVVFGADFLFFLKGTWQMNALRKLYFRLWWEITAAWLKQFGYKLVPGVSE
jgi:hypothetical protein